MSTFRTDQLSAIYICSVNFPLVSIWILRFVSFIYFLSYILLIILLQLSWFFLLCPSPHRTPHSLRQFPHHCSCPWVMRISSLATPFPILYCTSPGLFGNHLFVLLNPLASSPILPHSGFPFFFNWRFLWLCSSFLVWCCPICLFFFLYFPCPGRLIGKNIAVRDVWDFTANVFSSIFMVLWLTFLVYF